MLTTMQAKEIREGILMGKRNYENNCDADFEVQVPRGRLRAKAYKRAWVRCLYGRFTFPPKASGSFKKTSNHGPSLNQKMEAIDDGTIFTSFYDNWYSRRS